MDWSIDDSHVEQRQATLILLREDRTSGNEGSLCVILGACVCAEAVAVALGDGGEGFVGGEAWERTLEAVGAFVEGLGPSGKVTC